MLDNVISWAFLAVVGWIMIVVFLIRSMDQPSMKLTESHYITRIYSDL